MVKSLSNSLSKSLFVGILTGLIGLSSLTFWGCQNDLVSEPNMNQLTGSSSGGSTTMLAPTNLKATHGGYRSVTLSWVASKGAARYKIYAADSAFAAMEQVGETKDSSTSFTVLEASGISKYYSVAAVSYDQKVSSLSSKVFGSSLATPIITSIENGSDGTEATVCWWMDNCNAKTYQDKVCYEVFCFAEDKTTQVGDSITVTGASNSVKFTGLSGKTVYFYRVNAYTTSYTEDKYTEKSDMIDAETAHRLIPDAPGMFSASEGTNSSYIELKWTLPTLVDYKASGASGYERHPVYFKLERSDNGSDYEVLANYIGSVVPAGTNLATAETKGKYYFDCSGSGTNSSNISVIDSTLEAPETNPEYPNYTSGATIVFKDSKNLERGKKYYYRLQPYVEKNDYTDKISIVETTGWEIGKLSFSAKAAYNKSEENPALYSNVIISFKSVLESPDAEYSYLIKQSRTPFTTSVNQEPTEKILSFEAISEINAKTVTFTDFANEEGYYAYQLYVLPKGETDISKAYLSEACTNSLIVTSDATATLEINNFKIEDGYAHKYVLSWEMENISSCVFSIKYRENDADSEFIEINPVITGNTATYEALEVPAGSVRKYTLRAYNGFETEVSTDDFVYTLGLPAPEFKLDNIAYDSITVTWNDVQNGYDSGAKLPVSYTVSAKYEGTDTEICNTTDDKAAGYTVITSASGVNTCTITKPAGWDNPAVSGKNIILNVKAFSTSRNESESVVSSTDTDVSVCTLGPALCDTKILSVNAERINVKWNKIRGAKLYLIYRTMYNDGSASSIDDSTSCYYVVNTEDNSIVETNDSAIKVDSLGEDQSSYTLGDLHFEFDDASDSYSTAQQQLGWGLPFGYIVLPVKDVKDFKFENASTTVKYDAEDTANSSKVPYGAMTPAIGATYGFGLNVTAAKAENSNTVSVSWNAPYPNSRTVPFVYRKQNGASNWTLIETLDTDKTSYNDLLTDCDKTKSYLYAVQYAVASENLDTSFKSYLKKLDTTMDLRYNDGITTEPLNKGYLFYLNIAADYNGTVGEDGNYIKDDGLYYSEKLTHTKWDFTERARGPESFAVYAKNLNTTLDYIKLADVAIDGTTKQEAYTLNATAGVLNGDYSSGAGDTHISENAGNLILKPIGISAGTAKETNGIMKVLRSSKTYYKAETSRTFNLNGKSITVDHNPEVYAYRQITDEELAKCVGLIIADALYQAGIPEKYSPDFIAQPKEDASNTCDGKPGLFTITHTSWANYSQWSFNGSDYKHVFNPGTSSKYTDEYISDFTLLAGTSEKKKGASGNTLFYLAPLSITVKHENKKLDSCNCTITFTAGKEGTKQSWTLSILKNNSSIVNASNQTDFLKYFPYDIGNKHENGDKTANTSLETYKGTWWN